ncbi:MAG: peptidase T [Thermoanaerobaculia bacterium]|nr:peptidase T [Thermoanaerobaculia bacterium]MDI9630122.1 peptidase T [Acidobacteriota bacterium]MBP7812167.1 peptidase T [Thermoanaerobaculia bacterium]MBP8845734.1 peptidase T [Thermoanaerobaculia bacterium]HRR13653.1 peptidase T [Thermoanaerobaculia bacterium]
MSEIRDQVLERFLRYVQIDTQSNEESESYPSTAKQFDLLRPLVDELRAIGLADAAIDEWGYVTATIPATSPKTEVPVIGFIAHVDTSPEMPGAGVKPIVHRNYQGQDLVLPDDPTAVLRYADNPHLAEQIGNDIVTASGTTLLGADNKAGVAEIVTAAAWLVAHPEIPHGKVRIAFTPDEEVGRGTEHFDVAAFGAACAYTMDGETLGEVEMESFSADTLVLTFQGFNTHPGYAKGRLVNAIKIAADFINRLPREGMSPETTAGYEGYVHPYVVNASVERTTVKLLIRDFQTPALAEKEAFLTELARQRVADWPGATLEVRVDESYRNMREILDQHPEVVENAREAVRRAGLTVRERPIRGGTDGSRLCFMGLPTPNLFAGEHNFHSRLEWVSVQDMEKAVEVIVNLCRVFEERAPR